MSILIGIAIGQRREPTAICVAELKSRSGPAQPEVHFLIRYLDRLPVPTPYPDIARRLHDICSNTADRSGERPTAYVDATGVGLPVVDLLRSAASNASVVPVYFNHGDRRLEDNGEIRLGKAFLVSRLQVLFQGGRIHLRLGPETDDLHAELQNYDLRVTEDANERYGAFRVGTQDDLVTALGLAVQVDQISPSVFAWRVSRPVRKRESLDRWKFPIRLGS